MMASAAMYPLSSTVIQKLGKVAFVPMLASLGYFLAQAFISGKPPMVAHFVYNTVVNSHI